MLYGTILLFFHPISLCRPELSSVGLWATCVLACLYGYYYQILLGISFKFPSVFSSPTWFYLLSKFFVFVVFLLCTTSHRPHVKHPALPPILCSGGKGRCVCESVCVKVCVWRGLSLTLFFFASLRSCGCRAGKAGQGHSQTWTTKQ